MTSRTSPRTPRFGALLRLALESIGVHYAGVELLRKAKKDQTSETEYWTLWRLLHDVLLVVLADFDVVAEEMQKINEATDISDPEMHELQIELVRFYLYDWGFVCSSFYSSKRPSSQVLLLAFAWLVAYSRMFERQQTFILERMTRTKGFRLPPFPNDVDLDEDSVRTVAVDVVSSTTLPDGKALPLEAQMHQLHSAFGRLQSHLNELEVYTRYHQRLIRRLEQIQNKSEEHKDDLIPAYVLNLLAEPATKLADQVRVLTQSIQMIEDEALFYKWMNGLVLALSKTEDEVGQVSSRTHPALRARVQEVQTLFKEHAASFQQIEQGYKEERKKWISRQKSRSKVQQMETKVERFVQQVQTQELFDPQKLFLRSERSWVAQSANHHGASSRKTRLATAEDVVRLQEQLSSVIDEISQEYCGVQLR